MNPSDLMSQLTNPSFIGGLLHIVDFLLRYFAAPCAILLRKDQGWSLSRVVGFSVTAIPASIFALFSTHNLMDTICFSASLVFLGWVALPQWWQRCRAARANHKPIIYPENATFFVTTPFSVLLPHWGHPLDVLAFYNGTPRVHLGATAILTLAVFFWKLIPITASFWGVSALALFLMHGFWNLWLSWNIGIANSSKAMAVAVSGTQNEPGPAPSAITASLIAVFGKSQS